MAYGDYDGPDKPDKGQEDGSCNRTRCQASPANWYNHGSLSWYCGDCRNQIEFDSLNLRDWNANFKPRLKHPMFETRPMMDERAFGVSEMNSSALASHAAVMMISAGNAIPGAYRWSQKTQYVPPIPNHEEHLARAEAKRQRKAEKLRGAHHGN